MEGERILNELKKRSDGYERVCEDVKNYLSPVVCPKKKRGNALEFERLELFSLKLFKFCTEQLQKKNEDMLVAIAVLCMNSLLVCNGSSSKVPPLSFEKILLHFCKWCFSSQTTVSSLRSEHGLRACCELTARLRNTDTFSTKPAEVENLHKIVHDILWRSALAMEQKSNEKCVTKFCLDMRMVALENLLLSRKFEICAIFKSAMKVELRYRRAAAANVSGATNCGCGQNCSGSKPKTKCTCHKNVKSSLFSLDVLKVAVEFHSYLEQRCAITSLVRPTLGCKEFTVGIGYLLQWTLLLLRSPQENNGGMEKLRVTFDLLVQHGEVCEEEGHIIVNAQANCLQFWSALREEDGNDFLDRSLLYLNILTESLGDVISSDSHYDNQEVIHWLAESLELVFGCLRTRREACRLAEKEAGPANDINLVPRSAFQSFKSFILNCVEFLDIILRVHTGSSLPVQQEYTIRQNQLVLLSLMADALVDLLNEDEIEILRSSASDPLSPLMASPHPKKDLADCCMPLIKNSQEIISKAGQNVLSVSEHKWVANDAQRLGQALCNCDLLCEACRVLEVSCDELTIWCSKAASSKEERMALSKETRLLERFVNLCNVYCQNGDYVDALLTLEKAITSLSTNQIAEMDTVTLLVGQWVRVKRHIAIELSQQSSMDMKSVGRSLASVLGQVGGVSNEVRLLYLETELDMYQGQSYDTHSSEVTVVKQLLSLHSLSDSSSSLLHMARLTTRLSTISRICQVSSECSHTPCDTPLSLLDDAVAMLEPFITSLTASHPHSLTPSHSHCLTQAHQHLAVAQLWKAICVMEQNISTVENADVSKMEDDKDKEKKIELCLSDKELCLMMLDDITQCLFSAVENWEGMRDKASPLTSPLSEVFHDPLSMFHSLHLTATLCLAHSQPVLALRCLAVLLGIGGSAVTRLDHRLLPSYNSAVSLYNDLFLSTLGPRPQSILRPHPLPSSSSLGRREVVEQQCNVMMANLSAARVQLAQGDQDGAREVLLSMLSEPVLEQASTLTFMFVAKAKLLASEILQQKTFDLKSNEAFLDYISNNSDQTENNEYGHVFRLTPLELVVDAVKIFQRLASHRSVKVTSNTSSSKDPELNGGFTEQTTNQIPALDEDCDTTGQDSANEFNNEGVEESSLLVSSSVGTWDILVGVMSSLREVSRLYLEQGIVKEAHHYAREGAMLARGLLLSGWFTEFFLLLSEIETVKGEYESASQYCLQISKLLESESHCRQLLSSSTTTNGQSEGGAAREADQSGKEMADCDSFSDEDSFLEHVASLDIHTPPSSPQSEGAIKGTPPLHRLELHPQACLCQVCTNPLSLLHTASVVVQCCEIALWRTKDRIKKELSVDKTTSAVGCLQLASLLATALDSLREMVNGRSEKCDKILERIYYPEAKQIGHVSAVDKSRGKGSSRSTKTAPKRTKKSSKLSQCSAEPSNYSVTKATRFQCIFANITSTKSECFLLLERPKEAIEEAESVLSKLIREGYTDKELSTSLARLHYQLGVACVQEVELHQPAVARQLWEGSLLRKNEGGGFCLLTDDGSATNRSSRSRSTRKTTTRKTKATSSKSSSTSKKSSRDSISSPFSRSLNHFLTCYQLCFPNLPAVMTREVCQWVGLLVRGGAVGMATEEMAGHFLNSGINCTLTHQAVYSLGKKIRKSGGLGSSPMTSKSTQHHLSEIGTTFGAISPDGVTSQSKLMLGGGGAILRGRGLLRQGSTHPPTQSYTRSLRRILSSDFIVSTLCLGPKTHPSRQNHLLVTQTACGGQIDCVASEEGVAMGVVKLDQELLFEFDSILCSSAASVTLKERKEWWGARGKLDKQLKALLHKIESDCLVNHSSLLCPDAAAGSGQPGSRTVVLVLGRHIQQLPWEGLPILKDQIVCRMPSLSFMAAHRVMLNSTDGENGVPSFNPHSAYYILNPHGDLKNTEKRFANLFSNERGWDGIIGSPPSHDEFATALQEKDLYVYCGHSVGRFLASSGFQLLDCHATALLAGCSSAKLTVSGRCDPVGIPLSYLMAGCPALVGCLWDVTDGEIDRLYHALLKHLLGDNDQATPLPSLVAASRTACKLHWLTGTSTIVYGMPITVGVASDSLS